MTSDERRTDSGVVRPFAMSTRRSSTYFAELNMSTLVWTVRAESPLGQLSYEQKQIVELCLRYRHYSRQPGVAIAEIAAQLGIPMVVTKQLVSELIDSELLDFSQPATATSEAPDLAMMHRVLEGLRGIEVS